MWVDIFVPKLATLRYKFNRYVCFLRGCVSYSSKTFSSLTFDNVLLEEQTFLNERISAFFRYISNIYNIYDKLCRSTKKNYEVLLEKILIPERPGFYSH